jgi:hypothetical protein
VVTGGLGAARGADWARGDAFVVGGTTSGGAESVCAGRSTSA